MADTKTTALTEISVPDLEDLIYIVDDPSGTPVSNKVTARRLFGLLRHACEGRLTTESGVPVSTSDRSTQTTIYFTPYNGNRVRLYDGTRWRLYAFSEISLALSGLTSDKNYDVFMYDNASTLTLELSAAWTNDTTRADALTKQDGVSVKSGATSRLHVGTIRTTGTTTTEDSATKRFVWNRYNRVPRYLLAQEQSASWSYNSATWRYANGSSANRVDVVNGEAGSSTVLVSVIVQALTGATSGAAVGIGKNRSNGSDTQAGYRPYNQTSFTLPASAVYTEPVPLGLTYYAWVESVDQGASAATFYSDYSSAAKSIGAIIGQVEA